MSSKPRSLRNGAGVGERSRPQGCGSTASPSTWVNWDLASIHLWAECARPSPQRSRGLARRRGPSDARPRKAPDAEGLAGRSASADLSRRLRWPPARHRPADRSRIPALALAPRPEPCIRTTGPYSRNADGVRRRRVCPGLSPSSNDARSAYQSGRTRRPCCASASGPSCRGQGMVMVWSRQISPGSLMTLVPELS